MKITLDNTTIDLTPSDKNYRAVIDDRAFEVEIIRAEAGQLELLIDGDRVTAYISSDNARRWVTVDGQTFVLTKQSGSRKSGGGHHHAVGELTAPMPGQVRAVNVSEGDVVTKGQKLLVYEAMKMENDLASPSDGTVKKIARKAGDPVKKDDLLCIISTKL